MLQPKGQCTNVSWSTQSGIDINCGHEEVLHDQIVALGAWLGDHDISMRRNSTLINSFETRKKGAFVEKHGGSVSDSPMLEAIAFQTRGCLDGEALAIFGLLWVGSVACRRWMGFSFGKGN